MKVKGSSEMIDFEYFVFEHKLIKIKNQGKRGGRSKEERRAA